MQIRPAEATDMDTVAALHAANWRASYRGMLPDAYLDNEVGDDLQRQWQRAFIAPNDVVLVASDPDIVGFIAVWCRPDPFIDNLHVDPGRRSQGVGAKLMRASGALLRQNGHNAAYLWVLEDNRRAVAFYERLGGVAVERAVKPIFANDVPHLKIAWPDLLALTHSSPA